MGNEDMLEKLKNARKSATIKAHLYAYLSKDKKAICLAKYMDFSGDMEDLVFPEGSLTDKQAADLVNLIDQFHKIIKDYIKKEGVKENDNTRD